MKKTYKLYFVILLFAILIPTCAQAGGHTKEEVREAYSSILNKDESATYVNTPFTAAPYFAGSLSEDVLGQALDMANFMRWLAGLQSLSLSEELNDCSQHGAVLMAANQSLSHDPERPDDMDEEFFETAYRAAASSNLIMFNWSEEGLLSEAIVQFARDDGEYNRGTLGHRRWLLYPGMLYTGFGLAQDENGYSYAAMYVMDSSREEAEYDLVRWPAAGAFPAEYMGIDTPWSISPNPKVYDLNASVPRIELSEATSGATYTFDKMEEEIDGDSYFVLGGGRYGDGPAYIFHPDLSLFEELACGYQQNQVWTVRLDGMVLADGTKAETIEYTVEMMALTPIDPAAVEIMPREAIIKRGECTQFTAEAIPDWADDLTVVWHSEDESIATVDAEGMVCGVAPGTCGIVAETVNGKNDRISVTVTE